MNADIQPTLTQIIIYPIKSLDGKIVDRAKISPGGALKFDRRWAIVDERGKIVNAKRTAEIQQLRSKYDFVTISDLEQQLLIMLHIAGDANTYTFCLTTELAELARWLTSIAPCLSPDLVDNCHDKRIERIGVRWNKAECLIWHILSFWDS